MPFGGVLMCVSLHVIGLQRGLLVCRRRSAMRTFGGTVVLGRRPMSGDRTLQ